MGADSTDITLVNEQRKKARNEYHRKYYSEHKEQHKEYQKRYWERKVIKNMEVNKHE